MAKKAKIKSKKKSKKQLKALRELHNIVTKWTDDDFDKKGPFSDYCSSQRKTNKKLDQLLTDADVDNLSIASFTNYLEENSFRDESEEEDYNDEDFDIKKKKKKKKQKKSDVKRPLTPYVFFCKEKGAELRKENPSLFIRDFWVTLADKWKKLDEKEKKVYEQLSEKDKKRYEREMNKGPTKTKKNIKRKSKVK